MNKEELKNRIIDANKAYRSGNSIMTDQEYDNLLEKFEKEYPEDYDDFRNILNEGMVEIGTKIKHKYIAGSLDKLKYEEPETIRKFISKHIRSKLSVSAKIDGLSGILHYRDGKLVSFATRGDGYEGIVCTDKAKYIKGIPQSISTVKELFIRGELVILKSDYDKIDGTSPRNVVAGLINRKEYNSDEMKNVSFISYTIMGSEYGKDAQFRELDQLGFKTAWHCDLDKEDANSGDIVEKLFELASMDFDYQTDGLVISDSNYTNEERYRPVCQVAFKTNQQKVTTRLIDVDWQGPSKDGRYNCVGILDPIEISGVIVSKCTLHNLDFIEQKGVRIGDTISLMRSGDVIPKFIDVVSTDESSVKIEYPSNCPCCGSTLVREGPFLYCKNDSCINKTTSEVEAFIKNLKIENTSYKTLDNFGIHTIEDLLKFRANVKYKNEVKLENELNDKMFNVPERTIFSCLNMRDLGVKTLNAIIDFYGWDKIRSHEIDSDPFINLPENVGDITMNKFISSYKRNLKYAEMIVSDLRYHYKVENDHENEKKNDEIKGSVCITGSVIHFRNREEFLKMAEDYGYVSKSGVSKGLSYLVNNDIDSTSSKNKKAKVLGIPIVSEEEFMNIVGFKSIDDL